MDVPAIAVTGAAGLIAQALLPRLVARGPVIGLDVREPARRIRGAEVRLVDVARGELAPVLAGADVLVHLAAVVDPLPDEALMARVNVHGTRRVLEAASAVGIRKVVKLSGAAVYGAWATNPVPLREEHPLRPNPGFSPAIQAAEAERLIQAWGAAAPGRVVTALRTAPVLGPGAERLPTRLVLDRPRLRVRGASPPVQAVHVDDLVAALEMTVWGDHPGAYNVAADGWLDAEEAAALLGPPVVPALPGAMLARLLRATWWAGLGEVPPGVVPYLVHPWVVANDRLRALGWEPRHTNEEAVLAGLASRSRRAGGRGAGHGRGGRVRRARAWAPGRVP